MPTSRELHSPEGLRAEELRYSPQDHLLALMEARVCARYFCGKHPEFSVTELFSWGKARRGARTCSKPQGSAWLHGSALFAMFTWLSAVSRLLLTSQRGGRLRSSASGMSRLSAPALLFWAHTLNHLSASLYPWSSLPSERRWTLERDEIKGLESFK